MEFKYSTFNHVRDDKPAHFVTTWEKFKEEKLSVPLINVSKKAAGLWSSATYYAGATRGKEGVEELSAVIFDFDKRSREDLSHVIKVSENVNCALHTTHSYRDEDGLVSFRLIIPFAKPLTRPEHERALPVLAKALGIESMVDTNPKHVAAIFYWPSKPKLESVSVYKAFESAPILTLADIDVSEAEAAKPQYVAPIPLTTEFDFSGLPLPKEQRNKFKKGFLGRIYNPWKVKKQREVFYDALVSGSPFAEIGKGERDGALQSLVSCIAAFMTTEELETIPEDLILDMLSLTLAATSQPDDNPTQYEKAKEKLQRARRDIWADRQQVKAEEAKKFKPGTIWTTPEKKTETLPPVSVEISEHEKSVLLDLSGGSEIRHLLVYSGTTFVLSPSGYVGPILKHDFYAACKRYASGIQTTKLNKQGEIVNIKYDEIVREGLKVENHCYSYVAHKNYYDESTDTVYTSCAQPTEAKPETDIEIETWLELFAGKSAGKLFDWLATCRDLQHPTAILYFEGAPRTGKSLFAALCATLWKGRCATDMSNVLGVNFNDGLLKSPLIVADEEIPKRRGDISAQLRSMVATEKRDVSIKYHPIAHLEGCVRVVITANNDAVFRFDETLTENDAEAIAERVLHIKVSSAAIAFLDGLPDKTIESWVEGKFASYVKHLELTHFPKPGPRFLVEGTREGFVTQYRLTERTMPICHYLIHGLLTCIGKTFPDGDDRKVFFDNAFVRPEGAFVNQRAFVCERLWKEISADFRVPSEGLIRQTLKALRVENSTGSTMVRRPNGGGLERVWQINSEVLIRACHDLQLDEVRLAKLINYDLVTAPRPSVTLQ